MTLSNTVDSPPAMTAAERELWREEVEGRWGVYFSDSRMYQLQGQIWSRMQALSVNTFAAYHRLVSSEQGAKEWQTLLGSVLNHDTRFFRHPASFETLGNVILPEIAAKAMRGGGGRVAMWSAACSTGPEAYSLALTALHCAAAAPLEVSVEGTDISEQAIEKAREGVYSRRVAEPVPPAMLERFFTWLGAGGRQHFQAGPRLRSLVRFRAANLLDTPRQRAFDVIFCQNVLIYFRQPVRSRIVETLADCLNPGGFLVLAPGELPQPRIPGLEALRIADCSVFRRAA